MDILGLMAVLSFGLTCFGIGYSIGNSCWASVSADVLLSRLIYHNLQSGASIFGYHILLFSIILFPFFFSLDL